MSRQKNGPVERRRPSPIQGRGLEILGHAIEYLLDSYVIYPSAKGNKDDVEAAYLLMQLNRALFAECEEILPLTHRVAALLKALFTFSKV